MPPQVLAVTLVLQARHGLPDSEAVQAVRRPAMEGRVRLGMLDALAGAGRRHQSSRCPRAR
jgi:hypothetical protein